jgi:catechol 2,3-dioxygenase-like lactoylglutathione lyase family enzyme
MRVGSLRIVRSSVHYDATIEFYRDLVGLPVIDQFRGSYGEDGTIFGLPGSPTHLEICSLEGGRVVERSIRSTRLLLQGEAAVNDATKKLLVNGVRPVRDQHRYWEENGGITFRDPDGRGVVYASWVYGRDPQPSELPR